MALQKELKDLENPALYTIGWIAALRHERAAALVVLDERHNKPSGFTKNRNDANSYSWGRIAGHNVVIASLPEGEYGLVSAAGTAHGLLSSLPHVRIGLMVGIGAGVPTEDKILLGDVVVSNPGETNGGVVQYDLYKAKEERKSGRKRRKVSVKERHGFLNSPPRILRHALSALRAEHEISGSKVEGFLDAFQKNGNTRGPYGFPGSDKDSLRRDKANPRTAPEIHYGTIASGNTLIKNASERDALLQWLRDDNITPLCFEMEAAGLMNSFPCLVIRGICDYADEHKNDVWQRYAAATAAALAKELLEFIDKEEVEESAKIGDVLQDVRQALSNVEQGLTSNMERSILQGKLAVAADAMYNSYADANEHIAQCLEGTRTDLLSQVDTWANDLTGKNIFWLCGKAGTGKSTISRTVADKLDKQGRLGASFFFKRGEGDCGNARRFFTTIVHQLKNVVPGMSRFIAEALDADSLLCERKLQDQYERLLSEPLRNATQHGQPSTKIVVIDALDECDSPEHVRTILKLLAYRNVVGGTSIRVLVTSRPETPIQTGFRSIDGALHDDIMLEEVQAASIEHDIRLYLKHRFQEIREEDALSPKFNHLPSMWPGDNCIETLVSLSVPLFIFAFTVCRYISRRDPQGRLESLLHPRQGTSLSGLNEMYLTILNRTPLNHDALDDFRTVVGSIAVLAEPLSADSLEKVLKISMTAIDGTLEFLHSVLDIPASSTSSIRLHHLSFRDFLTDPDLKSSNRFHVDEVQTHTRLAQQCIQLLRQPGVLSNDLCKVDMPGARRADYSMDYVTAFIHPDVAYACCYWAWHMIQSKQDLDDDHYVYLFLQQHFLHWLEALSWLGRLSSAIGYVSEVRSRAKCPQISSFLDDAHRFLLRNRYVVDIAPLQVYHSALVFTPVESVIRGSFAHSASDIFNLLPAVPSRWSSEIQKLEGHEDSVWAVAFSPDGSLVASGSGDRTVRLWKASTGEETQKLEGHEGSVRAVAFSLDGSLVASGSWDGTVRLWKASTGEETQKLEGHGGPVYTVAFSPDGRSIRTNVGDFHTALEYSVPSYGSIPNSRIQLGDQWIQINDQDILWLPKEYRGRCSATYRDSLVVGQYSGAVSFFACRKV